MSFLLKNMRNFKLFINGILMKLWIKKNLNFNKYKYFFCPSGIGDTLYVLSYMKEYRKNNNVNVCFIIKKSHLSLIEMYDKYVDEVIVVNTKVYKCLSKYFDKKRYISKIIYAHPLKIIYDPCKILGIRGINLMDLYKVLLELPQDSKFCFPSIKTKNNKILKNIEKEDKKILLCPYCVSTTMLPIDFWEYIATYFKNKGFKVYTNVKDLTEKPIKNTESLILNLDELYQIANSFNFIFSIRSGLCDLISFSNVNLTVFYMADKGTTTSKEYDIYNLKNIGVRKDINELIVSEKDDIINYMKKFD